MLERILFEQMSVYFDKFLSDQQCGFRKGYSTQHYLLKLLKIIEKGKSFGALQISQWHLIASIMNDILAVVTQLIWIYSTCIRINS